MTILPKEIYWVSEIPIKIANAFFTESEQMFLKFVWNHETPWVAKKKKKTLQKEDKAGGITFPYFKLFYSTNHQNKVCVVLEQKQKREPRKKSCFMEN